MCLSPGDHYISVYRIKIYGVVSKLVEILISLMFEIIPNISVV